MNENILIVEDEEELCMTLGDRLRSEGYAVEIEVDGNAGLEKATRIPFDLIILDIMLPSRSGLDLCSDIRRAGIATPILFLTARSQTVDKVVGLKLGADDYVTKPFDTLELVARVEALLRRKPAKQGIDQASAPEVYRCGSIVLDLRRAKVTRHDKPVNLTAREFHLLRYFVEHEGVVVSRDELLREVWGHSSGTFTRTVDVHVASLRQKIKSSANDPELIMTVPGIGYRFQG
jgi:two-component system, OmpR family, alkaline phosphatase synthesis response regulator PhoP